MRRARRREDLVPDLTALIDIIFLLLIFFMVTSVFKKDEVSLVLQLPQSGGRVTEKKPATPLKLELNSTSFMVNNKQMDMGAFEEYCRGIKNLGIAINLRIDQKVTYDRIVPIIDILQKHRLSNLSLITESTN